MDLKAHIARILDGSGLSKDAAETIMFARELETILAQTYNVEYPELKATQFIPVNTAIGNAIATITYRQWDRTTLAKIISSSDRTLPRVSVSAKEFSSKVVSLGNSYGYSIQDLREAAAGNKPLDSMLAAAAREGHDLLVDEIAAFGNPQTGMPGFLNHPNIPTVTLPTGNWGSASADLILADLRAFSLSIYTTTLGTRTADTLLLDTTSFSRLQKPIGANYGDTILSVFLRTDPFIKNVDQWFKLNTANQATGGAKIVCYKRDPAMLELYIPQQFEQFPPQLQGFDFDVMCHSRTGGVVVRYPLGMAYATNM